MTWNRNDVSGVPDYGDRATTDQREDLYAQRQAKMAEAPQQYRGDSINRYEQASLKQQPTLSVFPNDIVAMIQQTGSLNEQLDQIGFRLTGGYTPEPPNTAIGAGRPMIEKEPPILEMIHMLHQELLSKLARTQALISRIQSVI